MDDEVRESRNRRRRESYANRRQLLLEQQKVAVNSGNEISVGETKRKRENVLQLDEQTNQKNKRPREFSMLSENIAQGMCLVDSDIEINVGERRQKRESELQLDEESNEANKRPRGLYRQRKEQNTSQLSALSGNIAQGIVQKDSRNGSSQTFERGFASKLLRTMGFHCQVSSRAGSSFVINPDTVVAHTLKNMVYCKQLCIPMLWTINKGSMQNRCIANKEKVEQLCDQFLAKPIIRIVPEPKANDITPITDIPKTPETVEREMYWI